MSVRSFRWRETVVQVDALREGDEVVLRGDDGDTVTFQVSRVGSREWVLRDPRADCRAHTVFAVRDGRTWWLHVDGRTWVLEAVLQRRGGAAAGGELVAPIPATVSEVLVASGDHVDQGDVLMVLSAMKMQLEVKAAQAGEVQTVHYGVGDQVDGGATLLEIDPSIATEQAPENG